MAGERMLREGNMGAQSAFSGFSSFRVVQESSTHGKLQPTSRVGLS